MIINVLIEKITRTHFYFGGESRLHTGGEHH